MTVVKYLWKQHFIKSSNSLFKGRLFFDIVSDETGSTMVAKNAGRWVPCALFRLMQSWRWMALQPAGWGSDPTNPSFPCASSIPVVSKFDVSDMSTNTELGVESRFFSGVHLL